MNLMKNFKDKKIEINKSRKYSFEESNKKIFYSHN